MKTKVLFKLLLIQILLLYYSKQADTLNSASVEVSPSTINSVSVFKVYAVIKQTIPSSGAIVVIFPSTITTKPSTSCYFTSPSDVTATCSYSTTSAGLIQLTAKVGSSVSDYFELNLPSFQNPSTTASTSTFELMTYSSSTSLTSTNLLDSQTTDIELLATTDSLNSASLSSSSSLVGETSCDLTVTINIKNALATTGFVKVTFPYWNPDASGTTYSLKSYMTSTSSVTCTGITNVKTSPTCSFDTSTQTLTMTNAFSSAISSSSTVSFKISTITNPVTPQEVSGFTVTTGTSSDGGSIDSLSATLQTSTAGLITTSSAVQETTTVVQEEDKYRIQFKVPVPLSTGCILEIVFPSQITLDSSLITLVQAFGLPTTQRTMSGSVDSDANSYIFENACTSYRDNTNQAIVYFTNIQNPDYVLTSDSIEIYISDSSSNIICSTNGAGPTISTTSGSMSVEDISGDVTEINSDATLTFSIQPVHSLAADSKFIIYLPTDQLIALSSCTISSVSLVSTTASCSTSTTDNTIIITSALESDYTYSSSTYISFTVSYITLPPSTETTDTYVFQAYTSSSGTYYLVDEVSTTNLFQATSAQLATGTSVTASSYVSYATTTYTFSIQVSNPILEDGYILINLPSELTIPTTSSAKCTSLVNFDSTASCTITTSQIKITNGYSNGDMADTSLVLSIAVYGIRNPRSQKTTSSFSIYTYTSDNYMIDYKTDSLSVTMTDSSSIVSANAYPNSYVAGATTQYMIQLSAASPLYSGDYIYLVFPSELNSPVSSTLSKCYGIKNIAFTLSCKSTGTHGVIITTSFTSSPLAAKTVFSFSVGDIDNPPTTEESSMLSAEIQDSSNYVVNKMNTALTGFTVQMTTGAKFSYINVTHSSTRALENTSYTFIFQLEHDLPASAQIVIKYPKQLDINDTYFACAVSNLETSPTCTYDTTDRLIYLTEVTTIDIEAGTWYTVILYGIINSQYAAATDSFQLETQTESGNQIDYATTGLTVTNDCDYPCITCLSNATSKCLSCDPLSIYNLLLNSQCLTKCPSNYYPANFQCYKCDAACKECEVGGLKCTKCYTGQYLQGNTCVDKCTSGVYYQNNATSNCDACNSPCATCTTSTSTCSSCLQLQQNPYKLLYQSKCLASCPVLTTVAVDGTCQNCSSNCKTCSGLTDVCTSCASAQKLDYLDMTCKDSCPVGITIDQGDKCAPCDSSCKTCASTNTSYCLSCQFGLNYWTTQHQCTSICPSGTVQITDSSVSICKECSSGCLTCQNTTDYCTKCDSSNLFYKFTCVSSCPSGYVRLSNERNICVKERDDCPYGYAYNDYGECNLEARECKPGYILNSDRTRCIPVPGGYVPLIFLIACLGWTLFIVKKYRKQFDPITIISQLLIAYTTVQTLTYLVMFWLSIALDYMMIEAVHLITLLSMILINIGFTLFFHLKLRKVDTAFQHFVDEHKKPYTIIKYVSMAWSFKSSRLLYSQLLKKPYFNAAFEKQYTTLIKPLFITTVVNFVIQVVPIILMDIYNLIFIPWGYQIMVMSIDNMILAVVIFILEIIEFRHYKKLAYEEGSLYKDTSSQFLKHNQQIDVMSAMDDSSMMQLNKVKDYADLAISGDTKSEIKKTKGKSDKSKEVDLLEGLIRKMKEESKFNQIYDDDEEEQHSSQQIEDLEMSGISHVTESNNLLSQKAKKLKVESTREKIENNLSFRINNVTQAQLSKQKALTQAHRAVFGQSEIAGSLGLGILSKIQEVASQNMESARTEKFNYEGSTQGQPLIDMTPQPIRIPVLRITEGLANLEQIERDKKDYSLFYEDFKKELEQNQRDLEPYNRSWHSFDENIMREWYDDLGPESDFHSELSRDSYPHGPDKLKSATYLARLELFRENLKAKYQYNNCYTHCDDPRKKFLEMNKNITRRTQTYEKDIAIGYDPFEKDDELFYFDDDRLMEIDPDFTVDLINNLIDQISDDPSFIENIQEVHEGSEDSDFNYEQSKSKKRKQDIQFDIDDIMGMFDIDDYGNIMLNIETMRDNLNRKVNKHGYLIDNNRHIINQDGDIIFEADELDEDEELPQPYRFDKRKKQLLKQDERFQIDQEIQTQKNFDIESLLQNEEEKVDLEFQKLKDLSRPSSVDSLIGNLPINIERQDISNRSNNNNDQDFIMSIQEETTKEKSGINQREAKLAKAYGGKPPTKKSNKKKKGKKRQLEDDDRLPTDRLFPSLLQEEERVKKMAMVAFRQEEKTEGKGGDFEDFFKQQMTELQQYRFQAKEDFNKNQQQNVNIPFYQDEEGATRNQDSVSTQKSVHTFWNDLNGQPLNVTSAPMIDPLQELVSGFDEKRLTNYNNFKNSNTAFSNYGQQMNATSHSTQQRYKPLQQQHPQGQMPQSVLSMNATYLANEDLSQIQSDQQDVMSQQQFNMQQKVPAFRKFDFYLPPQQQQQQAARLKKNLEKRDISFSSVGQMQMMDGSKIKGLERVYLQKYPIAAKTQTQPQQQEQRTYNPQSQTSLVYSQLSKRKKGGTLRNQQNATTVGSDQPRQQFMPSQIPFGQHEQMITNLNTVNSREEESETVFGGVANILNRIDRLKANEKPDLQVSTTAGAQQRKLHMHSSNSTHAVDRNNIMTQNNNWI